MGLSASLWFLLFFLSLCGGIYFSGRVSGSQSKLLIWLVCILLMISPMYMEYPGTKGYSIAVINGDNIEFRKIIWCEYLVDGEIVRLPHTGVELSFKILSRKVNSLPYIEIGSAKVFYKIVNYRKYISHKDWFGQTRHNFTNLLRDLTIKGQTREAKSLFADNQIEIIEKTKEYLEKARPQAERLKVYLQNELDALNSGIEITRVVL